MPSLTPGSTYLNRELSWLAFNDRVLALAGDTTLPLLERVKFVAIASTNLDEFFAVRVAGLGAQVAAGGNRRSPDGLSARQQLQVIHAHTERAVTEQVKLLTQILFPALAVQGMALCEWLRLDDDDRSWLTGQFERRVFPVLTPLAVDPGHPFPHVSSLSLNLAVVVRDPVTGERRFARLKVPPLLDRFMVLPDGERMVALEEVIAAHLHRLFPGMVVESRALFRVTRDAALALDEDEADDLLEAIDHEIRRRRFGRVVRLEVSAGIDADVLNLLMSELEVESEDVYRVSGPLGLGDLWSLVGADRPELKHPPARPVVPPDLAAGIDDRSRDVFSALRERDVLVHHPYESFTSSVESFVRQAAADPRVVAIKQTLYRTSGDSVIARSLIEAAERGKQVVALVELKARFDEQANIAWARALEQAGVHVVYGLVGLKTHTKTTLVLRQEEDGLRSYCHIGTGNYNRVTARLYEDIGLFSADPDLGSDLAALFNYLTGYSHHVEYRRLLVANVSLRRQLLELIAQQAAAGAEGRIIMKMNSLVDEQIIRALYDASRQGVQIDLVIRGICCLRPGVRRLSETIRVRSLIGRFLEHSRIFAFGSRQDRRFFIGSADLMPRNLDNRVEVVTPVSDPHLAERLQEILDVNLADDTLAWLLASDGGWRRVAGGGTVNTHVRLGELASRRVAENLASSVASLGSPLG
ncbi:MAG: polyphosphate kinase 1 [Acidimicrobiales bacterium]